MTAKTEPRQWMKDAAMEWMSWGTGVTRYSDNARKLAEIIAKHEPETPQAVNRKLVEALEAILKEFEDHDLGGTCWMLAKAALSEAVLPKAPIDMKFSHESLMRIAKEEDGVRFSVGSAEAALPQAAPTPTEEVKGDVRHWKRRHGAAYPSPQIIEGKWINEDELPAGYPYDEMWPFSKLGHDGLGGVRIFPAVQAAPAEGK